MGNIRNRIKLFLFLAWGAVVIALSCVVLVPILWDSPDNGYIRYGIIMPIYFGWLAHRNFKHAKEAKDELKFNEANSKVN